MLVRVLAAIAIAALAVGCATTPGAPTRNPDGTAFPDASIPAAPATPTSPLPTDAPSATPDRSAVSFELVYSEAMVNLSHVAPVTGGYLAGGCRRNPPSIDASEGGCREPLLLRSTDGRSWTAVALPEPLGQTVTAIAQTPFGQLVLGTTLAPEPPLERVAWRSIDGTRWEPFSIPAPPSVLFETVVVLPDRVVFFGSDHAYEMTVQDVAWATADGLSWTSGETPIIAKVGAHPGLVAVGTECVDVCDPEPPLSVYRSNDGFSWTGESIPAAMAKMGVSSLAVRDGRAVVGGRSAWSDPMEAVVWHDGPSGWRETRFGPGAGPSIDQILVTNDGEIAVGQWLEGSDVKAWWSTDGDHYEPLAIGGIADRYISGAAGQDPLVVVVDYRELWIASF